jgi:hypothetical protein
MKDAGSGECRSGSPTVNNYSLRCEKFHISPMYQYPTQVHHVAPDEKACAHAEVLLVDSLVLASPVSKRPSESWVMSCYLPERQE